MANMHAGGVRWVLGLALWAGLLTSPLLTSTVPVWAANSAVSSQPLGDTAPAPIATLPLEKQLWGGTAWADVNPEEVAGLLESLPAESSNAWVHDATHQLLLTAPPTSTETVLPITKLRVDHLVQLGYFQDAAGLLAALPSRSQSTPINLRRRLLDLLATPKNGETAKAFCGEVEQSQGTLAGDLPNWLPNAAVWCLWQKGDQAAAEVGLNVLQEQLDLAATPIKKDDGAAKSPEPLPPATTLKLLNSVVTNTPVELASLISAKYTPNEFDLWLLAHANLITGSMAKKTAQNTLPAIAKEMLLDNPKLTPELRAEWGGELVLRGYVDNSWLQNIRDQVSDTTSPDPQKLFAEWPAPNHHQQWLGYGLRLTPSLRDLAAVDQPAGLAQQVVAFALYRGDIELARRWLRVAENRDPLQELLFSWLTDSQGQEVLGNRLIQRLAAQPNTASLSYAVQLALMQTGDDSGKPSRGVQQWMREWRQQLTTLQTTPQAPDVADTYSSLTALDWLSLSSPAAGWWAENATQNAKATRLIAIIRVLNTPAEGKLVPAYGWALAIKQLKALNQDLPAPAPTLTLPILPAVQAIVWSAQSEGQKLDAPSKSPAKAGGGKPAGAKAAGKPEKAKP